MVQTTKGEAGSDRGEVEGPRDARTKQEPTDARHQEKRKGFECLSNGCWEKKLLKEEGTGAGRVPTLGEWGG